MSPAAPKKHFLMPACLCKHFLLSTAGAFLARVSVSFPAFLSSSCSLDVFLPGDAQLLPRKIIAMTVPLSNITSFSKEYRIDKRTKYNSTAIFLSIFILQALPWRSIYSELSSWNGIPYTANRPIRTLTYSR